MVELKETVFIDIICHMVDAPPKAQIWMLHIDDG